jgi:hypothetical protein
MSKLIHNPSGPSPTTGFTLLELMLAMALSLLFLGLTMTLVQQLGNIVDIVGSTTDVNENVRAAVGMVSRDLSTAGENIPLGGIPLPYTAGTPSPTPNIKLPNPAYPAASPWTTWSTFPTPAANAALYWPVITAGNAQGPTQGSGAKAITTDIVTLIRVIQTSSFNQTTVDTTSPNLPTIASGSATITVSATAASYVSPGQLIMLTDINGSCLLAVSSVNTTTGVITFTHGDATNDPLGVNQFPTLSGSGTITSGPTSGTILQLETATTKNGTTTYAWPTTLTAYSISMVTYYLDTSTPQRNLTKLVTMGTGACASVSCVQVVAVGINAMQISYSLSPPATLNGVQADPTRNPWPTTTDPGNSPNDIRKVVLAMIGETDHQNHANGQWYSSEIKNAVTIQNLDYYNKYSLGASMTSN